jgi:hypothetical protein
MGNRRREGTRVRERGWGAARARSSSIKATNLDKPAQKKRQVIESPAHLTVAPHPTTSWDTQGIDKR